MIFTADSTPRRMRWPERLTWGAVWRPRGRALALLTLVLGVTLLLPLASERSTPQQSVARGGVSSPGLASLPLAAQAPVSRAVGGDQRAYRASPSAAGIQVSNPVQALRATFGRDGVRVDSGATVLRLALHAAGYGNSLLAVDAVFPYTHGNRITYAHRRIREWYANGPLGLEQGFAIPRPLQQHPAGPLTLSIALATDARVGLGSDRRSVSFDASKGPSLRYRGLLVTDSSRHVLPSWLQVRPHELLLRVDTRGARYPVSIDPMVEQAKLTASEEKGEGHFGASVAVSANGNTALIGGETDNTEAGAAWVFTRSGSTWSQQAKLTGTEETLKGFFGTSVALSADGNTALIGGSGDNTKAGAAWVFTRSGSTWSQQGPKLTGGGEIGEGLFGSSVALSSDGNTALVGAYADSSFAGAAWAFTRSGSTWSQQEKLSRGKSPEGEFGDSVALSSEGNTALIGARSHAGSAGAAWVFTLSGSTWSLQQKLTSGESTELFFGDSVALSSAGSTALVGGPGGATNTGAAWVFTRSGSTWSQQEKLTGSEETGKAAFGARLALASEGNVALIAGPADNSNRGAAWVFARSGSTWSQQGKKVTGGGEIGTALFGFGVALSSEANTALVGGLLDNGGVGATWAFENQAAPSPPSVETKPAASLTQTSATLNASVNPNGAEVTECKFEYGTSTSYGSSAPCSPAPGSGTGPVAVSAAITGLGANTTYHFRVVAKNAGGESTGADETFQTAAPAPSVETKPAGPGAQAAATPNQGVSPSTSAPPTLGRRQTVRSVSGTVSVRVKGRSAFAPLTAVTSIPDGSEIDATNGRIVITVATPSGQTVSAEVYGGRFRIHQDPNGETHFILTLPLTGCPRVTLPTGSAAAFTAKRRGPRSRHLWVSETNGKWGTNGRFVSTSVAGTTWLTLDECTRSQVLVTAGKVKVRDLVRKKTKTISAGQRYVASSRRK